MSCVFIVNTTKGTALGQADMADSFASRFRGLMLKKKLERGLVLKIPKGRGKQGSAIHMFFMRISIDVVFLDSQMTVVDQVHLKPWQTYTPQSPARYVIELEKGLIQESSTEIGDKLNFTCDRA
jgi:uncharacterized protein